MDPAAVSSGKHCVDFAKIAAFIEVHIEQSARLDNAVTDRVGVVTGIRGLIRHRTIQAIGETAHAGAVDFPYRKDAALACARFLPDSMTSGSTSSRSDVICSNDRRDSHEPVCVDE